MLEARVRAARAAAVAMGFTGRVRATVLRTADGSFSLSSIFTCCFESRALGVGRGLSTRGFVKRLRFFMMCFAGNLKFCFTSVINWQKDTLRVA